MNKIYLLIPLFFLPILVKAQAPVDTTNIYVDTTGQRDLLDVANSFFKFKPRKYPKSGQQQIYFSVLPISSAVPGGSKALVTSTTAGFFLGPRRTTYISSVTFAPYFNLKGRYGLPIHSSIWTRDNRFNVQGDTRFLVYPQFTWGLGGGQPNNADVLVNFDYVRFYQDVLKRITPYFYAGVGYDLDYFSNVQAVGPVSLGDFTSYQSVSYTHLSRNFSPRFFGYRTGLEKLCRVCRSAECRFPGYPDRSAWERPVGQTAYRRCLRQ